MDGFDLHCYCSVVAPWSSSVLVRGKNGSAESFFPPLLRPEVSAR